MSSEFQIQILTVALQHSAHTHHPPPGGVRLRLQAPQQNSTIRPHATAADHIGIQAKQEQLLFIGPQASQSPLT
jgi:hypothetical protein